MSERILQKKSCIWQIDYKSKLLIFTCLLIFWDKLFSYMWLTTIDMKWNTFIEHKVVALICEESGLQKL
jgi:hypothetical protein